MTGTYTDMFPVEVDAALTKIYALSVSNFGFKPTLYSVACRTFHGFAIFLARPVWDAGSVHTPETYATELRDALGEQYVVGTGEIYISVAFIS